MNAEKTDSVLARKPSVAPKYKMESPKFPHPWTLWYHHPDDSDWSQSSYMQVGTVSTPSEFWSLVDGISRDAWENGMFFFMKKGVRPLWDVPENERGGAWSKKVDASETYTIFIDAMVYCVTDRLMQQRKETLQGITVSPKGAFHIIKIWNTDSRNHDKRQLATVSRLRITDDVTYTPHKMRPK